jgi:uncharacterized protein
VALGLEFPSLKARTAKGSFIVNGKDVLLGLADTDVTFTYTDSTSDKADDLCIEIADPQRTWMLYYLPNNVKKGMEVSAKITITDWKRPYDNRVLECGIFWINHVSFKGPPNFVTIKASSVPANAIKGTKKHRAWENSKLKSIAGQIASENGLELYYDTQQNPEVKRTDQSDKSDLEYLRERCKESKLSLKIHKKQLVIYSEQEYEAREPAFQLVYGKSNILTYEFNSKVDDTYNKAEAKYVNPETGKLTKAEFPEQGVDDGATIPVGTYTKMNITEGLGYEPDGAKGGGKEIVLFGLEDADQFANDDPAANKGKGKGGKERAKGKCKAKMREKNKKEHQCTIHVFGNIEYLSGLCCQTVGFGIFDKKWFIESSVHKIGSDGYHTDLKLRGALKGY